MSAPSSFFVVTSASEWITGEMFHSLTLLATTRASGFPVAPHISSENQRPLAVISGFFCIDPQPLAAFRRTLIITSKSFGRGARRSSSFPLIGCVSTRCSACSITRSGCFVSRLSGFQP